MTAAEVGIVTGGIGIAVLLWAFMFRLDRRDIWPRTWVAAIVLAGYAITASIQLGEFGTLVGPVAAVEVLVGAFVGLAWVVATQLGAALLCRAAPSFLDQTSDLYRLASRSKPTQIGGALVAMAIAEEVFFRGLIQAHTSLIAAVIVYAGVQMVEGKWALVLAAALSGLVWGGVYSWRSGLIAPLVAHGTWTLTLTLAWPVRGARSGAVDPTIRP